MRNKTRSKISGKISTGAIYFFLTIMLAFSTYPILQVYINSLRSDAAVKLRPIGFPASDEIIFTNFAETWNIGGYGRAYLNSLFLCAVTIILILVFVGLGAYALAKIEFKGRDFFVAYFFVAISLPGFLYIVPNYFMFARLGLTNSHFGLILLYFAMQIPFNMLLLRTFLTGIPREIEEAAKIDGCSEINAFIRITVPVAKPIFMMIALLVFVNIWNEYLWAQTFIQSDALKPVATRFFKFVGEFSRNMARIYTGSVLTITPIIILYLIFSRRFIEGMTSGSIKA